jgi:hypothetical protein
MVTVVTPAALCTETPQVLPGGATFLAVNFTTSESCAFSFVTYQP